MPCRLRKEEIVTIQVLAKKGVANTEIAQTLGVTEGTVRYHLRRQAAGAVDGRAGKVFRVASLAGVIAAWIEARGDGRRPVNVKELHEHLTENHSYDGTYKSVLRFVRRHYPRPKMRTYRRVETPPGAQTQTDWGEFPRVSLSSNGRGLSAFVMVLSHSRMPAVIWSESKDQVSWLTCHNRAYTWLRGVAAVNRVDNVKTAIATGAGPWGEINPAYRTYAKAVGFHIDACLPRQANAKGKVENKVLLARWQVNPQYRSYSSLEDLQQWTQERLAHWAKRSICPATGHTVYASWEAELEQLASLPLLPEPFDIAVTRPVHKDCMVNFEGRQYAVPFEHVGRAVEVRGCAGKVQILGGGRVLREYPRGTMERVLIDATCYEGKATDRVIPPPPLGRMGQRLQEIMDTPVERRPVSLYQELSEVAR
jgi:transposase